MQEKYAAEGYSGLDCAYLPAAWAQAAATRTPAHAQGK